MLSSTSSSEAPVASARALGLLFACFALTVMVLAVATEALVRSQVVPQDNRPQHLALLEATQSANVALGDSHVARAFDAKDPFVNLAYPSETIEDMLIKARAYFAHHAPRRVVLQADPHLFARYRLSAPPAVLDGPAPQLYAASEQHRPQLVAYWASFIRNGGTLVSTTEYTPGGAQLSTKDLSQDGPRLQMRDARYRIRRHSVAAPEAVAQGQAQYGELVDYLTGRGAEICFVSFPVSPAYAAARDRLQISGHAEMIAFFRSEAARVDARYLDMRDHVTDVTQFEDIDHLNATGATAYSRNLIALCGWAED